METDEASPDVASRKTRRLFTGLKINISQSLSTAIKKMRIGAERREIDLHWVIGDNYHLTLNFLGATAEAEIPIILDLCQKVCEDVAPFSTSLRGVGCFPDDHHMRTLWIGVRNCRALQELQTRLHEQLTSAGFIKDALDERPYIPHLTIAKTRKARSATDLISPFVRTKFGEVEIETVILFESVQHGPHTTYKVLASFPLNGSASEALAPIEQE